MLGLLRLLKLRDLRGQRVQPALGGTDVAHHVPLGELLAQVRHGLLHVSGGGLRGHALFQQHNLGDDVVVLPREVGQGLVVADVRVLPDRVFFAVDGQEDVPVALNAAPAGGFGQRGGGGSLHRRHGGSGAGLGPGGKRRGRGRGPGCRRRTR